MLTKDEEKTKHITSDIKYLKQKLKTNQKPVSMMEGKYTQRMELAEKKHDLTFVVKGNGLKRKYQQVKEEMKIIKQDILALEAKKKKLLEKQILKAVLLILLLSCAVLSLVLFCLAFSKKRDTEYLQ